MNRSGALDRGRAAFEARQWGEAYLRLFAAHEQARLEPPDLDLLAAAAYLTGHDSVATETWTTLYQAHADAGACDRSALACFWLSFTHILAGEMAPGSGWLARAGRLLDQHGTDCVATGYVTVLEGLRAMMAGDLSAALAGFSNAISCSRRFADHDLLALGLLGEGQTLARAHKIDESTARLDEAMVGVSGGEVSPILAGIVYCAVIRTCQSIFDVRRAREWTFELSTWCAAQPELVPFRGQCLVHRSEILQFQGDWPAARDEARNACASLAKTQGSIAGRAYYQRGELHRLCGEFNEAETMYRQASLQGCDPQPGAAQLLLMQGKDAEAAAAIRSAIGGAGRAQGRFTDPAVPLLLGPFVEILLAAGETESARQAASELAEAATQSGAQLLEAWAAQARGLVDLADGDLPGAESGFRTAWTLWQQLECPYAAARVRVWLAEAGARSGDGQSARHHRAAARAVFERLAAIPDLEALDRANLHAGAAGNFGLTNRECEILTLVAEGDTNRQIAKRLHISQHTVARHLSNIFDKLGVTTRTAAGAFAHTHDLVERANSQI